MERRAVPAKTSIISKSLIGLPEKRLNEFGENETSDCEKLVLGLTSLEDCETSPLLMAPWADSTLEFWPCSLTPMFDVLELPLNSFHAVFLPATLQVARP